MASRGDMEKLRAWKVRLERYRASGLTVARFCEQENLPVHAFYYWSRRNRSRADGSASLTHEGALKRRGWAAPQPSAEAKFSRGGLVRFQWNESLEVSVPADQLEAIRCLVECLQHSQRKRRGAFQEVVVTS